MAVKKSQLYSSLWASCDELRGGMDASQYKDYVLALLFIKYISDKFANEDYPSIEVPQGASFKDMVALKGKPDIGDKINTQIIQPLMKANKLSGFPDFNDVTKLGSGSEKEMAERLTNLIAIFEDRRLDFSKNRADGDDILGDAYEYLMRHFATESGKSKGQFYTPAEVSRVLAEVLGIRKAKTNRSTTVYDPTCGSASLLLKVAAAAPTEVSLYGQEKDVATAGLARMNMILHNYTEAIIMAGNTLAEPKFLENGALKTFDFVVANPPFSDKRWSTGLDTGNDEHYRFQGFGVPPSKQGDFAYLLHIVRSLKPTGKAACILPHGVLFRGNAEGEIRRNLVKKGYIKAIIGLPANLFYGTGIPACILVIDKEDAHERKGIFMIDASNGYLKDGPKNRLREQDIHKIVDCFQKQDDVDKYARFVPIAEIEANDYNLNLPRYIDSSIPDDVQDIAGHLQGGVPERDVEALTAYWNVCPGLRDTLFSPLRDGYLSLAVDKLAIKTTIFGHPENVAFRAGMQAHFEAWRDRHAQPLKDLEPGFNPKRLIPELSEDLLLHYAGLPLIDAYTVYQQWMDYWAETMQDDAYLIAADGWKAETYDIYTKDKKGKEKYKGWACDLLPKELIVCVFFAMEQAEIDTLAQELELLDQQITELEEEHSGEEAAFADLEKINKANVAAKAKELKADKTAQEEYAVLKAWLNMDTKAGELRSRHKRAVADLDANAKAHYKTLDPATVRLLVVDMKWMPALEAKLEALIGNINQTLTQRVRELAERYEAPLSLLSKQVADQDAKVREHLERMGFVWN